MKISFLWKKRRKIGIHLFTLHEGFVYTRTGTGIEAGADISYGDRELPLGISWSLIVFYHVRAKCRPYRLWEQEEWLA